VTGDTRLRAYRVAYDGQPYHGFQRQPDPDVATVEDALLAALGDLGVVDGDGTPEGYAAAGRTDAGTSALAQTVAFAAPEWLSPSAFNSSLPDVVRVWASTPAPKGFHATYDAAAREYTYFLYAPEASERRGRAALDALAGEHDFHNLTPDDDGTVREIETVLARDGPFLVVMVRAGGFPRQFVRRFVSLVAEVARGDAGMERIERVLSASPLSGPDGVSPAPAEPLVLSGVFYPDLSFTVDDDALAATRSVFAARHAERAAGARVAAALAEVGRGKSAEHGAKHHRPGFTRTFIPEPAG